MMFSPLNYEHEGRFTSVADGFGEIVGYRHTPGGKVKEIRHRNGVRTAYEYDTEGNIIRLLTETRDGEAICDLQYEYDLNGNRTAKKGTMTLPDYSNGVSAQIRNVHYRYDVMNRLTAEDSGGEETSYRYDLCGNRLEKRKGGKTEKNCYNRKNQLICRETEEGSRRYIFDLQGNLIKKVGIKEEREYFYDTENRQIRISSGGRNIQENRYDGEGLRAGLTVDGKKSTFLYGNQNLYAEFDEAGEEVSRYIWGNGLAGLEWQGKLYGVHRDEQLSTGWVTGETGNPENAYEYDAFGVLLGRHENVPNRLLYGGQQYDGETEQQETETAGYLSEPALQDGVLSIGAGKKPIEGAYNIDTNPIAEGVYMGDATDLGNIASGSQKLIIIENPYGYDPLNSEILRVLATDGTIEITGARSNRYANKTPKRASELGLSVTEEIVPNIGQFTTTNGTVISPERTQKFVKYILKPTN